MKKILKLIVALNLNVNLLLNTHIVENTKNIFYLFESDPTNINLSKFKINHNFNENSIQKNDININSNKLDNSTPEFLKWSLFFNISKGIDNKYDKNENDFFGIKDIFSFLTEDESLYKNNLFITILQKSYNSTQPLNDNKNSFNNFEINNNEIKFYNLRISNNSSMNWNVNKSYFDVSVNICNFDSSRPQQLSNKQDNLNTQMLPDTNISSSDTDITDYYGNHPTVFMKSFQDHINSHNNSYNTLHKFFSNNINFSTPYVYDVMPNPYGGGSQTLSKDCNWTQNPNNENTLGHIDLEKICPQFTSVETAKFFLSNISIQSSFALNDICTPNSNSHYQDKSNEKNTFAINEILTYDQIKNDSNKSLPWDNLPNTSIKTNDYYIPNSQYDHQFKKHWFQNEAGHIYYAAFMALANSTLNIHTIDAFAIFTWQMSGTVYAGINLSFAIHSNEINYNFNDTVFANNTN